MKFFKLVILVFSLNFLLVTFSNGKDIYVDNKGLNKGDGSLSNPYLTIQEAANVAIAGDIIMIRNGTYRESVIIKNNGITIIPYNNEDVIINGTDPLFQWEKVNNNIFKTAMKWNVTEGSQSNQIFVDGEMMHLTRWPQNTASLVLPTNAYADKVEFEGDNTVIYDADFKEAAGRWDGCEIWINLSRSLGNTGWDGQGWTGKVLATYPGKIVVSGKISGRIGDQPWGMGPNLEFYLFNPFQTAVAYSGGITSYLQPNQWWKKGDTLFVNLLNSSAPASESGQKNLIEAKKRIYGISPEPSKITFGKTSIIGLHLFATSITTDLNALNRTTPAFDATNNLIDGINAKYVTHFTNQTGDWQGQWDSKSGIILSGINSVIKNCTVQHSAAAAICAMGKGNKVLNNTLFDCNYNSTETGVLNTGTRGTNGQDHEIAYNTIYNTPQQAISIEHNNNSDRSVPGRARVHHNIIHDFMLKTHDSAALDVFGIEGNMARWDHNIIYNSTNFLAIGMYCDFGKDVIIDHNLMWNVESPIQLNYRSDLVNGPFLVFSNTVLSSKMSSPGISNGVGTFGPDFNVQNNISTGQITEAVNGPVVLSNVSPASEEDLNNFFTDYTNNDYTLKSSFDAGIDTGEFLPFADSVEGNKPDLGCFEYGMPEWKAGVGNLMPEFVISDSAFFLNTAYKTESSWTFPVTILPFSGFEGGVSLGLGAIPEGITVDLPVETINPNEKFFLTVQVANTLKVGKYHFDIIGKSGDLQNTRTYIIEVPQAITSVNITETDTVLNYGSILQVHAIANDQEGNSMRVQPTFIWSASGGGQINNRGKYVANKVSDNVIVVAKYQGFTDTLHIKVVDINNPAETLIDEAEKITVYPNPAGPAVTVSFFSSMSGKKTISIYNALMSLVMKQEVFVTEGENQLTFNTAEFPAGMYFLNIENQKHRISEKFILKH